MGDSQKGPLRVDFDHPIQMAARGVEPLDAILAGEDEGYNPGGHPDEETAVLGRLDDDFQLWRLVATTVLAAPGPR